MTVPPSRTAPSSDPLDGLVCDAQIGSEVWWDAVRQRGTPMVRDTGDDLVELIFLHRDQDAEAVLVDLNGVTDHHSLEPAALCRHPGTDVWWWRTEVRADFRGSYCFIPLGVTADGVPPEKSPGVGAHREWWLDMLSRSVADATSHHPSHPSSWGTPLSAIHLVGAPDQSAWTAVDHGEIESEELGGEFTWTSALLGNERSVWVHQLGEPAEDQPLVIVLDGGHWARRMPLFAAMEATRPKALPSCLVVLIDVIDSETRARELPCHAPFWEAVVDELIPDLAADHEFTADPDRTVVAGQSFGGLAALYAGLTRPDRFGRVITQSGSFWWPDFDRVRADEPDTDDGWLTEQVWTGQVGSQPLWVFQQVGRLEGNMNQFNDAMREALEAADHRVTFSRFEGGHEWLCWRGGLVDGLRELLPAPEGVSRR